MRILKLMVTKKFVLCGLPFYHAKSGFRFAVFMHSIPVIGSTQKMVCIDDIDIHTYFKKCKKQTRAEGGGD